MYRADIKQIIITRAREFTVIRVGSLKKNRVCALLRPVNIDFPRVETAGCIDPFFSLGTSLIRRVSRKPLDTAALIMNDVYT